MQLGCTVSISVLSGVVFWHLDYDLDTGVLTRVGLVFFLGLYFMLTALAPLPLWTQDRLLYFQERAAGCYGAATLVLSRTLYDGLLHRVLPALLCAAIVYPMAGTPWHAIDNTPHHPNDLAIGAIPSPCDCNCYRSLSGRPVRSDARHSICHVLVLFEHVRDGGHIMFWNRVPIRSRRYVGIGALRAVVTTVLWFHCKPSHIAVS